MSATSNKADAGRTRGSGLVELALVGGVVVLLAIAYAALWSGRWISGASDPISSNPFSALIEATTGDAAWPVASTVIAIALLVLCTAAATAAVIVRGARRPKDRFDDIARHMAAPKDLSEVTGRSARAKAQRLRPELVATDDPGASALHRFTRPPMRLCDHDTGIALGATVSGNATVFMSWEDVLIAYAGTRMGKTAALAVPAVCTAPGPVAVTSNKRDLHDLTRGVREKLGRIWLADLQGVAAGEHSGPGFFWNPLRGIASISQAKKLASYFADASRKEGSRVDSYFDGGAQALLALHILAAAVAGGDLLHVYGWLSKEAECELPKFLLRHHDQELAAMRVETAQGLNPRQRDGLYDMARRFLEVLEDEHYARSVLPNRRTLFDIDGFADTDIGRLPLTHDLPEFVVADFATSTDTLYALSMEGPDSAAPLTTALMGSVLDAAVQRARISPKGRLQVPMVPVLDEAANVCKLGDLPQWYSHFGSQGICLITILQSPSQAGEVWGQAKVEQMSEAANFVYYGGGLQKKDYLGQLSTIVGDRDVERWSSSRNVDGLFSTGGQSTSQSWSREAILTVDELAQMPKDRALLTMSGNPPMLIKKAYWSESQWAAEIRASEKRYGIPTARRLAEKDPFELDEIPDAGDGSSRGVVIV